MNIPVERWKISLNDFGTTLEVYDGIKIFYPELRKAYDVVYKHYVH